MNKREQLIETYANELKEKCGVANPDMDLLTKIAISLGPSIYNADAAIVAASDKSEVDRVKESFLINKLGLKDGPSVDEGLDKAIETYGRSNRRKYRAVLYYLLTNHFRKSAVFG